MPTPESKRVLHLGNILNNGYLNAKFLRRVGWSADSVSVDYRHVQAQPEWEDVAFTNLGVDHFNPDWTGVDLGPYRRVDWFHDVDFADLGLLAQQIALGRPSGRHGELLPRHPSTPAAVTEPPSRTRARAVIESVGLLRLARATLRRARVLREQAAPGESTAQKLVDAFAAAYPHREDQLTLADVIEYQQRSLGHGPLLRLYPIVQAYALDPIYPLINDASQPLVCFEHGTLRDFPFEKSARGRLYALAVKHAEQVLITNADCNRAADRLGLTNYRFVPHPVDESMHTPGDSPLRERLKREHRVDHLLVAPARHHWKHCPPGLETSWFKRNDILIRGLGRFFAARPHTRALVVFFEWGQEVALSKQLIAECGIAERVRWEPIASKPVIHEYYNAADIVFDQFNDGIGTFGGVVPESLATGTPVMLNYKKELHHWCFPELPPLVDAKTDEDVANATMALLDDESYRRQLGEQGLRWFRRYHSSQVVTQILTDVYDEIAERRGWTWRTAHQEIGG